MDDRNLERLLRDGTKPRLEELIGWDYRGFNMNPATECIGTEKFFKGFFGEPGRSEAWGYSGKVIC